MRSLPEVVGPGIQDHAARQLGRATLTLVLVGLVALTEWISSGLADPVSFWALLGVPASAGALVAVGWRGVQQGFGRNPVGVLRLAGLLGVVPFAHGLWLFGVAGLRRVADGGPGLERWLLAGIYVFLGLRLLRDTLRVHEVATLAQTMIEPGKEEG
jgi:hypothetical protein